MTSLPNTVDEAADELAARWAAGTHMRKQADISFGTIGLMGGTGLGGLLGALSPAWKPIQEGEDLDEIRQRRALYNAAVLGAMGGGYGTLLDFMSHNKFSSSKDLEKRADLASILQQAGNYLPSGEQVKNFMGTPGGHALAGAGIGGLAGLGSGLLSDSEDPNYLARGLSGATLGGLMGGTIGGLRNIGTDQLIPDDSDIARDQAIGRFLDNKPKPTKGVLERLQDATDSAGGLDYGGFMDPTNAAIGIPAGLALDRAIPNSSNFNAALSANPKDPALLELDELRRNATAQTAKNRAAQALKTRRGVGSWMDNLFDETIETKSPTSPSSLAARAKGMGTAAKNMAVDAVNNPAAQATTQAYRTGVDDLSGPALRHRVNTYAGKATKDLGRFGRLFSNVKGVPNRGGLYALGLTGALAANNQRNLNNMKTEAAKILRQAGLAARDAGADEAGIAAAIQEAMKKLDPRVQAHYESAFKM